MVNNQKTPVEEDNPSKSKILTYFVYPVALIALTSFALKSCADSHYFKKQIKSLKTQSKQILKKSNDLEKSVKENYNEIKSIKRHINIEIKGDIGEVVISNQKSYDLVLDKLNNYHKELNKYHKEFIGLKEQLEKEPKESEGYIPKSELDKLVKFKDIKFSRIKFLPKETGIEFYDNGMLTEKLTCEQISKIRPIKDKKRILKGLYKLWDKYQKGDKK